MSYAAAFAPRPLGVSPHRSDDSQVWQVAAPCAGVVAQQHIARVEVSPQVLDLKPGDRCRVGRVQGQGWRRG